MVCDQCDTGLVLGAGGSSCTSPPCIDTNCIACVTNLSVCDNCASGYTVAADFTCVTVCGDGIVAGTEQCDDANALYGDGCTPNCTT